MSKHANLLADLYLYAAEADHEPETIVHVDCECGEMTETAETWGKEGPRIIHRDFYCRIHSPVYCGTSDDGEAEWMASRSN